MKPFIWKIATYIFAVLCALSMLVVFYACSGQNGSNRVVVCDHNYQDTVVQPTCTVAGYTLHKCTKCGDSIRVNEVAALGHNPSSKWQSNANQHWHECENGCGERVNLGNHDWNAGVVEEASTCDKSGRIVYTCTTCGFERADVLPATGHNLANGWMSDNSSHWRVCQNDSTERINYALHNWDSGHVEKPATCKEEGIALYTCTVCGKSITRSIAKIEHVKSKDWEADANSHWRTCQICGEKFETASHTLGEAQVTKEPTCIEDGVSVRQCSVCGTYVKTTLPSLGHLKTAKWYTNKDSHWHRCSHQGCEERFDMAAHTFGAGVVYLAATCTSNGLFKYTCSVCDYAKYESIPATGHSIDTSEWVYDAQQHWHECANCDGKFDAKAHDYEVTTVPSTSTEQGYTLHKCKDCGYEYKDAYTDPLGD